jgi:nitrogen fixation/metabolism regulation signal transduction histidine kinase
VLDGDSLIGAVVVHQGLDQALVTNIIALQNFLKVYALTQYVRGFIWIGMVVLFVLLAIGGAVLAALLARSVTRPILSLVAGTREVARGNLDHRVEVKGKDEIAVLVESFNSMVAQLKTSTERLLRAERLAAWRDVARRIAHEIKNPLTPIQLSMYRLRKNLGRERYDEIFQQSYDSITKEVDNLRNMVTEFSQFARMPKPRTSSSSPNDVVQDAINLYTGLPDNIVIHTELAGNLPQVMVDRDQIRQVLHNIIGNAVDAMPDGGELSVRTYSGAGDVVSIEVSDTGCGMSEEVKQQIFTPYFTTKEKGTGLGMVITAQIIEEHGGEISVESEEGVGTQVTVKLKSGTNSENVAES